MPDLMPQPKRNTSLEHRREQRFKLMLNAAKLILYLFAAFGVVALAIILIGAML